jgi:hypothetical protein
MSGTRPICLSIFFILFSSIAALAQSIGFLQPIYNADLTPQQEAALAAIKGQATTSSVQLLKANPQALDQLAFASEKLEIMKSESGLRTPIKDLAKRSEGSSTILSSTVAKDANPDATTVIVKDHTVTASIQADAITYSIRPIGGDLHVLVKVDPAKMPPDHPPSFKEKAHSARDVLPYKPQTSVTQTTITVLVGYTPAVKKAIGDVDGVIIGQLAQLAIANANASYQNSGVNIKLVAAPANPVLVNLTETGDIDAELATFASMQDVKNARAANHSNVAVLFVDDHSACGNSAQIYASKETAFSVVYYECEYDGNYSFAHEIGHLQGARHNPEDDPQNTPIAYCHGFMDPARKRRTIMAYECPQGGCIRQPQWSRPNDWGNATTSNDARVLNETATYIASFR